LSAEHQEVPTHLSILVLMPSSETTLESKNAARGLRIPDPVSCPFSGGRIKFDEVDSLIGYRQVHALKQVSVLSLRV